MVESREVAITLFLGGILAAIPSIISPSIALQIVQIVSSSTSAFLFYYGTVAPRRWKPTFELLVDTKTITPELGLQSHEPLSRPVSGKFLQIVVLNSMKSKINANHCRAKLLVEGITAGEEYLPWRYIEVASGRGSGWRQYHDIEILRGDSGLLLICWTEAGQSAGYIQTSSPGVQWRPYELKQGVEYNCKLTIFGDFKPSLYRFCFKLRSEDAIEFTKPTKVKL